MDGKLFILVSVLDVKDVVKQFVKQFFLKVKLMVQFVRFDGNQYGVYWGIYNNMKVFFDYKNNLFVQQVKGVVDVFLWQNDIDWVKVKVDGVEGVIICLGYGWGNSVDKKVQCNINECKCLGILFGIYWYLYVYDVNCVCVEGNDVVVKFCQMGVDLNDLRYLVFYDLE